MRICARRWDSEDEMLWHSLQCPESMVPSTGRRTDRLQSSRTQFQTGFQQQFSRHRRPRTCGRPSGRSVSRASKVASGVRNTISPTSSGSTSAALPAMASYSATTRRFFSSHRIKAAVG